MDLEVGRVDLPYLSEDDCSYILILCCVFGRTMVFTDAYVVLRAYLMLKSKPRSKRLLHWIKLWVKSVPKLCVNKREMKNPRSTDMNR